MLENLIKRAAMAYYNGKPIMTDEIFDYLQTIATEESIGYKSSYERRYKHLFPLFSLQKVISGIDSPPDWGTDDFIVTPKLDKISFAFSDRLLLNLIIVLFYIFLLQIDIFCMMFSYIKP